MPESTKRYNYFSDYIDNLSDDGLDDASVANVQTNGDYLDQKSNFDNNLYDPQSYYDALLEKNNEQKVSKEDGDLYGFIPGEWLPDWVKAGYQNSITGLADKIATGEDRFDLSNYSPSMMEDVGATLISFLQPLDILSLATTGGIGGIAAKSATKAAVRKALKSGVGKGVKVSDDLVKSVLGDNVLLSSGIRRAKTAIGSVDKLKGGAGEAFRATTNPLNEAKRRLTLQGISAKKANDIIEKAAPKVLNQAFQAAAVGGTQLGFYSGLQSSLGQIADPDQEFDLLMNIKNASKGAVLGSVTAGSAPIVKSFLSPNLNKLTQQLAVKAVETAEFGTLAPIMEGELPTAEDYVHSAAVIGALNAQKYATGKITKGYRKIRDAKKEIGLTVEEGAQFYGALKSAEFEANQVYTDRNGFKVNNVKLDTREKTVEKTNIETGVEKRVIKEDIVTFKDLKTSELLEPITFSEFQSRGFSRSGGKYTPEALQKKRIDSIFGIKKEINMNDANFLDRASKILKTELRDTNINKVVSSMTPVQQLKLQHRMRKEAVVNKLRTEIKKSGWETTMMPDKLFSDYHGLKFLDRAGKRLQTQISGDAKKRVDNYNVDYFSYMGTLSQMYNDIGLYAKGMVGYKESISKFTKEKLFKETKDKLEQESIEIGRKLQNPKYANDPVIKQYREIFDYMWEEAKKAGVDLGKKEEWYFPRIVKQDVLKIFSQDFGKLRAENPQLFTETSLYRNSNFQKVIGEIVEKGKVSKETRDVLYEMAGIRKDLSREQVPDFDIKISGAFRKLNTTTNVQYHNVAEHLQISRKAKDLPESILETDARIVMSKYGHQWARKVAESKNFGNSGEFWVASRDVLNKAIKVSDSGSKRKKVLTEERDVLDNMYKILTNKIELDPSHNWKSPQAKKVWSDIVDFEIGSKIGLGFATVPNITQVAISTALKTGYYPIIKGIYKLSTSKEYRDLVGKSGVSNISIYQSLAGLRPNDSNMGKFAEFTTWASGFQKMNQINQLVSAAAAKEWVGMLQPIAQGKGTGKFKTRQNWARENLRELGISNINNISETQISKSMYRFARDTQLQRNILEEPLIFNDPRFRPLFLFKKFGYKQFNWVRGALGSELKRGNIFPMLRLASAGLFGGEFVSFARDKLATFYAGEEVFNENEYFLNFGNLKDVAFGDKKIDSLISADRMTWGDALDRFASVGAMGISMDIVAAENTIRAIEFAGKPAVVQDFDKIWQTMTRTWENLGEYGSLGALQRMPKYLAPLFGTVPRRLAQRIEPSGQKESYVKYRKGFTRSKILDYMIEGDSIRATRLVKNWNRSFPQNPILYDDIGVDDITKRILRKAKKKLKP